MLFGFEVVDDGSILEIKTGATKVKYITVCNFEKTPQTVRVTLRLEDWPNQRKPEYQVDLAAIQAEQINLAVDKKIIYPVYLNAYKRLEKGLYTYWLDFTTVLSETNKNNVNYKECQTYHLPLIIKIN